MAKANAGLSLDEQSNAMLYEGANLSQLGILFKKDHRVLKERMHGIQPIGKRNGFDIFDIAQVAERMVVMTEDQVDKAIMRLNHADLPKTLSKEYWAGKRSRQEFELKEGNLWPTDKVVEVYGEMMKNLRMELDLTVDGVERLSELTERQRQVLINLIDGTKANMLATFTKTFGEYKAPKNVPRIEMNWEDDEL